MKTNNYGLNDHNLENLQLGLIPNNEPPLSREEYEKRLKKRQQEHLNQITKNQDWQPCLHDKCEKCVGTGITKEGGVCIHMISCSCPKCTPK